MTYNNWTSVPHIYHDMWPKKRIQQSQGFSRSFQHVRKNAVTESCAKLLFCHPVTHIMLAPHQPRLAAAMMDANPEAIECTLANWNHHLFNKAMPGPKQRKLWIECLQLSSIHRMFLFKAVEVLKRMNNASEITFDFFLVVILVASVLLVPRVSASGQWPKSPGATAPYTKVDFYTDYQ